MKKFKDVDHLLRMKPFRDVENLNDNVREQLNLIADEFNKKTIYRKLEMIKTMIKYDVGGKWVDRLNNSIKFGRDSSSLDGMVVRYGEDIGKMLFNKKIKDSAVTLNRYIKKYGKIDGKIKWDELCKSRATHSLDACIARYGKIEGSIKWQERLSKKIATQKRRRESGYVYKNGRTLLEYQQKYGIGDGYNRWLKRNKRQSYMVSTQRYIDIYGEIDGRKIMADVKNNSSLDKFIERYGEVDGKLRYDENCKRCAITEEKMIEKYGDKNGKEKYKEWIFAITQTSSNLFNRGYSKISQELFWELYKQLPDELKNKCYFAELNKEYQFFVNYENKYPNKIIMPDFKCGNSIIEFDGVYWHNENLDKQRDIILESKGYKILRITDIEYEANINIVVKKCKEFVNENA